MTTQLEQLRDHARLMAGRRHATACPPKRERPKRQHTGREKWCGSEEPHAQHAWTVAARFDETREVRWECAGICGGCVPDSERSLWVQIADEIDAHLTREVADASEDSDALFALDGSGSS